VSEASAAMPPPPRCLVDTDVLSYVVRGDRWAESYRAYLAGKEIGVSFQTVAELRRWGRTAGDRPAGGSWSDSSLRSLSAYVLCRHARRALRGIQQGSA
jgi:predicted nucleic acid-binding protein